MYLFLYTYKILDTTSSTIISKKIVVSDKNMKEFQAYKQIVMTNHNDTVGKND